MTTTCHLLNVTVCPALGSITPLQALTGQVPNISFVLHFTFWEPVYYKVEQSEPDSFFPSHFNEKCGHWVSLTEDKGDQFTWKILMNNTNIHLSIRSAIWTSTSKSLTLPQGKDTRLISHLNLLYMTLPLLMKTLASCSHLTLMTSWGESSSLLLKRMGSTNKPISSNKSTILKIPKLPVKTRFAYASKFNTSMTLKSLFPITNSWISWNRVQNLKSLLMVTLSSGQSTLTKAH